MLESLYPAIGVGPVDELRRITIATSLGFFTFIIILYLMYIPQVFSRTIFIFSWFLALGIIPFARYRTRELMIKVGQWGEPVAVIGSEESNKITIQHFNNNKSIGLRPVLQLNLNEVELNQAEITIGSDQRLLSIIKEHNIRCAIISNASIKQSQVKDLEIIEDNFERVIWIDSLNDQQLLWITFMDLGGLGGIERKHELLKPWARTQKRGFDILGSIIGLIVCAPIFILIGLLIIIDSPGSVFYQQIRVGKDGKKFNMLKFRTMFKDAEETLNNYLSKNFELREEWDSYQKLKDDPRITAVGRFLRLYSLDELPQLWNILLGDMSLVGPRPFMPEQEYLHRDSLHRYKRVRPGLTGMWQVYGRNEVSYDFRLRMDEYYFRNWSLWLDLYILVRTPWIVLRRIGAY